VREVDGFVPVGRTDAYATYQRATVGLDYYVQLHRNKEGKPSVEQYPGRLWTPLFPIDIDNDDLRVSLEVARQIARRLDGLGVPLKAVRFYFSGSKGFSIELPATLFGGFEPSSDLPRRLKRAAALLLPAIAYDASIYSLLRLWRAPNSRHSKTRLYKVQLTASELLGLDIEQMQVLAASPRRVEDHPELTPIPDDEWHAVDALVDIWARAAIASEDEGAGRERRRGTVTDEARDRQTVAAVVASWPAEKKADLPPDEREKAGQVSRHHDYLLPIVGFLARRTSDEHLVELLIEAAEQSGDRDFLAGRDYRSEIERLVASSSEKARKGEKTVGLPTLAEKFPALADVLRALWPDPTIGLDWDVDANGVSRSDASSWPEPLADEAYYGLVGELVRAIEPHSEADPAAILAHALTGLGTLVGPHVHAMAGDAPHPARLNAVVVGETAIGRKGSAHRANERALALADPAFVLGRMTEGLSSGEGLIWQVRDPIYRREKVGKGADAEYEDVLVDAGIDDKRLWVVESEFASVLRVAQRDGNTLTAIVRRAWDQGDIGSLTKTNPARTTGAHISIVGHVSRDELLRYLDRSELASGFANRFLFIAARRARILPEGEGVPIEAIQRLAPAIREVATWAAAPILIRRDAEARAIWAEVYGALSDGKPGLFGAATNRAAAQVLRLSVLYAILDCSPVITADHLLAALAVWRYAEQSARWVFGDAIGDPTADAILAALRRAGPLTRNDLVNLFDRHVNRARIERALMLLLAAGLVRREEKHDTGGRPAELWQAV
jgi:hypothetical protein